ncbi:DUF1801 domain-containing protein [Microbacterium sp. B2969]|uniref:DUF1801 domain-containing protein n=1 Tax=Microbacterium alkaliflavum TaxID=3248839 RepID=A0ABW7Q8X6_9MICO
MKPTGGDVAAFVAAVTPAVRRRDAETMIAMMSEVSGREPVLWGTIVGFGSYHYRYPTGTEGDVPLLGFSPRRQATTVYLLDPRDSAAPDLSKLGPHTTGASCVYLKDLADIDLDVLRAALTQSLARLTSGAVDYAEITVTG